MITATYDRRVVAERGEGSLTADDRERVAEARLVELVGVGGRKRGAKGGQEGEGRRALPADRALSPARSAVSALHREAGGRSPRARGDANASALPKRKQAPREAVIDSDARGSEGGTSNARQRGASDFAPQASPHCKDKRRT